MELDHPPMMIMGCQQDYFEHWEDRMRRILRTLFFALIIFCGGWLLYHKSQINSISDAWHLAQLQLGIQIQDVNNPFGLAGTSDFVQQDRGYQQSNNYQSIYRSASSANDYSAVPVKPSRHEARTPSRIAKSQYPPGSTVRIASFKIDSSSANGQLQQTADICQQFDAVAIQNNSGISISQLVNELNLRGNDFRFVDRKGASQKFGIIFSQRSLVLDQQHWYTVNDPENLFLHEPLVAWFRTRNALDEMAFTFTLANIQLNPKHPDQEMAYLGELFRAIRNDGRNEDDIILAGDFYANDAQLEKAQSPVGLTSAIIDTATNTRNDTQLDNIVFDEKASVEFTGASGAFDFMKRFNMTLVEALAISNRMPVWAEFSVIEGQSPGRAAERYEGFNASR